MARYVLIVFLFRLLLPFLITLSICFRPCGLCGIYVLLRFYLPFVPVPTSENMKGHAGIFLKILLGISILTFTSQVVFQITLVAFPAVSEFLEPGSIEEKIFQHVGFVPLKSISISDGFIWMSPEVIMLFSSIFVYAVIKKLTNTPSNELGNVESGSMARATKVKQNIGRLVTFGRYVVLVLLCTAGVLRPSIFSGVYYLVFLSAATWWACYKQLNRTFAVVLYCLAPIVIVHLAALYTYQLPWPQELVDRENPYLRYFGITALFLWNTTTANVTIANITTANVTTANVTTNSTVDPRHYTWNNDEEWVSFIHTECIFVLFYFMILEAKELFNPEYQQRQGTFARLESSFTGKLGRQMSQRLSKQKLMRSNTPKSRWQKAGRKVQDLNFEELNNSQQPGETTPLLRGVSPASKRSSAKKQDSTASGTFTGEDIPLDELGDGDEEEYELTIFDNILYGLETVLQLIVRSSYIGTNIIMMAWSITYLSWITFVLLIWANLIWLVPKQRKSMLATSPFLVLYAWFLLVSGLIYSMRLTEEELPSRLNNVDLAEIGFVKVTSFPCGPLFVKSLFTVMFWVTLRQFMQERMEAKQTSALADMVAPLQVTVGTATVSGASKEQEHIGSKVMGKVGNYLKTILTKYWILVVAITLFAVAITGQRMTGFRILYMALFLLFVITFQLSFRAWRKMMFGFWLTIIIYSMMILIATYTYQFKEFPKYWTEYLHVSKQIQADMGLEQFETKQLFVRLVTPTFFVIITVIQLHYFHKDFMELSDPKNTSPPPQPPEVNQFVEDLEQSSMQGGAEVDQSAKSDMPSTSVHFDIYALQGMSKEKFYDFVGNISNYFENFKNILYLFLELHMIKFVLFFAMLICIFDMCAIYIIIIVLISLAFTFGRPMQIFAVYSISILVSIMILARMIFQVQYIKPEKWSVTCNVTVRDDTNSTIKNNAPWLGFQKEAEAGQSLPGLVKWNIMYILAVTVYSVVIARQYNYRLKRGLPTTRAFFMFPDITRKDADKNISNCIQYLCNFGFYKFGFEMTAMMIVALIDLRLDIYAFFHAVFLFGFCFMSRATIAKVWIFYLIFIAISLPFQYFMVIGILPTLCYEFPWDGNNFMWEAVQDWAFLLDNFHPLDCRKLICDFLLLVFVSRQWVVFRIEKRYVGKRYAGGSNESVIHYIEEKDFKNPVHDYVTYVWSYLCIVKKLILQSFLWVTLAMVFLCGTNRVNIYSLGYLIFVFFFLWHGSDLYLRPIPKILRWWQWLIGYTAGVILLKTIFQMVGCVFCTLIETKFCWAVQMLSVMCVRKFKYSGAVIDYNFPELDHCGIEAELVGVAWDVTCLVFLLLQRRVFNSYYFFHIIDDAKADTILASRGAELLEERRHKTMKEQSEQEKKILEKIKIKMDRIKRNQQKIQGANYTENPSHFVARPPLARSSSDTSCTSGTSQQTTPAGYHTPIDDEEPTALTPRSSLIQPQAPPSPYSAVMTVSLEGYLEPQRISFSSPPNSELNPRPSSPDDSFPVFSPPPYNETVPETETVTDLPTAIERRKSSTIGPPWLQGSCITPRQSIISYSSRSPLSHYEYSIYKNRPKYMIKPPAHYKQAIRSGDYYMFDELEDEDIDLLPEEKEDEEEKKERLLKPGMGKLLSTAIKEDVDTAIRNQGLKRQLSMPVPKQPKPPRSQLSGYSAPPTIDEARSVRIAELPEEDEPQPGTSKDEDDSDLEESKESIGTKIVRVFLFLWAFFESAMVSLTNLLNKYSRNYRYVLKVLAREKRILKERTNYKQGLRNGGTTQVWQPAASYHSLLKQSAEDSPILSGSTLGMFSPSDSYRLAVGLRRMSSVQNSDTEDKLPLSEDSDTKVLATSLAYSTDQDRRKASILTVPEIRILAASLERGLDSPCSSSKSSKATPIEDSEYGEEISSHDQPTFFRLILAIWYIIMSRSEFLCYFFIFLNQIKTSTFLTLPLPLMIFFWGALTIPRPSKTFWITIIAYTEVIVLLKCIFQFDVMPGNTSRNALQFSDVGTDINALNPTRIFGLHRERNYAFWDLLVLLVVFFHRILLKSMGIWSSTTPTPAALLDDGEYILENDRLVPVPQESPSRKGKKKKFDGSQKSTSTTDETLVIKSRAAVPVDFLIRGIKMTVSKYAESLMVFNQQLLDPTSRVAADVYFLMFFCDFFNFFVLLFGYSSFGSQQDGGVQAYLEDNRVPPLFLCMLLLQFMLIIIDRGIYLRKNILAKIIFQYAQIILLHIWLFVIFPVITGTYCYKVLPPQIYYMVKCFYLLLSAYQIRCGYPSRILGNFLCKGYGYVNMWLFRGFMIVPFLFELRTCMDWMWTETSMTIFDWIKMEDIFQHIYLLKCTRTIEDEYPQPRGEKKKPMAKYLMGGAVLAVIIAIIWFPLVFFSLGNTVGEPNIPVEVHIEIRLSTYEPLYKMTAQSNSIYPFTGKELTTVNTAYNGHKNSETFLYNYEAADIAAVKLSTDSANIWSISPPDRKKMLREVNSSKPLTITLKYDIIHKTIEAEDSADISKDLSIILQPSTNVSRNPVRDSLFKMLKGENATALLEYIFPKFLKVTNKGEATPVSDLMLGRPDVAAKTYRNMTISLQKISEGNQIKEWWTVKEQCNEYDFNYHDFLKKFPHVDCRNSLVIYTFNDRIFPQFLNFLTGGGIIGLYTTLVLLASRLLRGFFADQLSKIMFDDLPFVDRVLQLCLDVYLVREASEFSLEEDLFAKLVFLFRSPETLIKWTRPKEEVGDEDDDEDDDGDHPEAIRE